MLECRSGHLARLATKQSPRDLERRCVGGLAWPATRAIDWLSQDFGPQASYQSFVARHMGSMSWRTLPHDRFVSEMLSEDRAVDLQCSAVSNWVRLSGKLWASYVEGRPGGSETWARSPGGATEIRPESALQDSFFVYETRCRRPHLVPRLASAASKSPGCTDVSSSPSSRRQMPAKSRATPTPGLRAQVPHPSLEGPQSIWPPMTTLSAPGPLIRVSCLSTSVSRVA